MRSVFIAGLLAASAAAAAPAPSYHVIGRIAAGDGGWDILSVDPVDQRLYIGRTDGVTAIDLRSGKATDRIVPGQRVHAALAIPGTHEVISTNGESNTATLFDGRTGQVRATIATGQKPDAAAYDPATATVWVMDPGSGEATVIDPKSTKVLATVPIGGSLEFAVSDGRGRLYANVEDKNEVAVIDTRTRKVLTRFPLQGCEGPTGIAYDAAARELLSACAENAVAIVSGPDGRQIARLPIGRGADGAAFDDKRGVALVPAGRDGNLTIIRLGARPAVVGQVATKVSARTIAVDPSTGSAYLPSATLAPAQGNERPKPLPGTFRVIVVAPYVQTRENLISLYTRILKTWDTDRDGRLSRTELAAMWDEFARRLKQHSPEARFDFDRERQIMLNFAASQDANHDGYLTLDELLKHPLASFDCWDTDHDGNLTQDEAYSRLHQCPAVNLDDYAPRPSKHAQP